MRRPIAQATLAAILSAGLALPAAASIADYSSFFVFGDSLSDDGNLYRAQVAAGDPDPTPASPPYFNGRFSNGPVWDEAIAAAFGAMGRATANFAYGGAQAVANGDAVPDLPLQIGIFAAKVPQALLGGRPLASVWLGANDLFALVNAGTPADEIAAPARLAADAVLAGARGLAALGVRDFLIANLPDLGAVPAYALLAPASQASASAATAAFNDQLAADIAVLRGEGNGATLLDVAGLFTSLLADPAAFGVANATVPCVIPGVSVCAPDVAATLAFFDPVHPTAPIHEALTRAAEAALGAPVAPVPLPAPAAMLLAAFALLPVLRRRQPA